jgi:hypothetical protein
MSGAGRGAIDPAAGLTWRRPVLFSCCLQEIQERRSTRRSLVGWVERNETRRQRQNHSAVMLTIGSGEQAKERRRGGDGFRCAQPILLIGTALRMSRSLPARAFTYSIDRTACIQHAVVARMMRTQCGAHGESAEAPDCASLHPGYR